jgi:hypothetical protein
MHVRNVRNVRNAHTIFHGVMVDKFPMITRRLDTEERRAVREGNVYVWEERGRNADAPNVSLPPRVVPCSLCTPAQHQKVDRQHPLVRLPRPLKAKSSRSSDVCGSLNKSLLFESYFCFYIEHIFQDTYPKRRRQPFNFRRHSRNIFFAN